MSEDFGVVYVATKEPRYLDEACESRDSLQRHCPAIPATLFTSMPDKLDGRANRFDRVIPIDSAEGYRWRWTEGQLDRLRCLPRSPYRRTLQLDTDTRVHSPRLAEVAGLLNDHDIVIGAADPRTSQSCAHFGPMYHLAAMGYRRCDAVDRFLATLTAMVEESFALGSRDSFEPPSYLSHVADRRQQTLRQLLMSDQVAFARLLSPSVNRHDLSVHQLPGTWLFQQSGNDAAPDNAVVLHGEAFKQRDPNSVSYADQLSVLFPAHMLWRRFDHVDALNEALAQHCLQVCTQPNRGDKAAIGGRRSTGNFFDSRAAPVAALKQMVDDTVLRYLREAVPAQLPPDLGDMEVLIDGWAYVMEPGDMLAPHLHRDGFATGTYYVEMPDLGDDDDGKQGRLVLMHPAAAASMIQAPKPLVDRKIIDAGPGALVLFPSYLQHHVNPFNRGRRIAISFDIALRKKAQPAAPAT